MAAITFPRGGAAGRALDACVFKFPDTADGLFFTGTSQATLVALVTVRGPGVGILRSAGTVWPGRPLLTAYAVAKRTHVSHAQWKFTGGIVSAAVDRRRQRPSHRHRSPPRGNLRPTLPRAGLLHGGGQRRGL